MSALPEWVGWKLGEARVTVERYGRARGRPSKLESNWFFCGWYWSRTVGRRVVDGPFGPFPCRSAAETHALEQLNLTREGGTPPVVVPLRRYG